MKTEIEFLKEIAFKIGLQDSDIYFLIIERLKKIGGKDEPTN